MTWLLVQTHRVPHFLSGTAQPAWSVLQSDCVMVDQLQKCFQQGHIILCDQIVQRLIKFQVMY